MSIALITCAFKAHLKPIQKLVLLALCDSANDQGECYPAIQSLAEKCSASERTVQECVASLEREGYLIRDFRVGRSTLYQITDPRKWRTPAESAPPQNLHPTPANCAPPPPQTAHPTPANCAPITVNEPSIEPKKKARHVAPPCPAGVDRQVWDDWLTLRRTKRAPVTATVLDGASREASKAGLSLEAFLRIWCRRGSQGLEAAWLKPEERSQATAEPAWRTEQRERMRAFAPGVTVSAPRRASEVIDLEDLADDSTRRLD